MIQDRLGRWENVWSLHRVVHVLAILLHIITARPRSPPLQKKKRIKKRIKNKSHQDFTTGKAYYSPR